MKLHTVVKRSKRLFTEKGVVPRVLAGNLGFVDLVYWHRLRHSRNTFILGLGNQRCGTTWLYKYLNFSNRFDGGILKEYHIWDGLDIPAFREHRLISAEENSSAENQIRYQMQQNPDFYFNYFTSLYSEKCNLSADITPSYSGLDKSRLKFIKHDFARRGVPVKVVISIRNPVERIKSAVQFNLDRQNYREGIERGTTDFGTALEQYYPTAHCQIRTNYHEMIERALDIFGRRNVYIAIFETMFSASEIAI